MKRRIIAWILILLFVVLMINLLFIGYHRTESGLLYILATVIFLFGRKKLISYEEPDFADNTEENEEE